MRFFSMIFATVVAVPAAIVLVAGCTQAPAREPALCPATWTSNHDSQRGCLPSEAELVSSQQRLGTGVLGFARFAKEHCSEGCALLSETLLANVEIRAYRNDAQHPATMETTPAGCQRVTDKPVAIVRTNGEGVFEIALPPGQYLLGTPDPSPRPPCEVTQDAFVDDGIAVVPLVGSDLI